MIRTPSPCPGRRVAAPLLILAASIAAASPLTTAAGETTAAAGTAPLFSLPALGNTPDADRPLLREIGDDHVHAETPESDAAPSSALAAAGPSGPSAPPRPFNAWQQMRAIADGAPLFVAPGADGSNPAAGVPTDIWTRLRNTRRISVPDREAVRERERVLRDELPWVAKTLHRGTPYLAHVVAALDRRFMPLELALLPAIESGYQPRALSTGQAAGLWQIVPITAREVGIERTDWFDARADIVVSTEAALDYLAHLNARFHGDWELTLAAYNAGPGRVRAAVRRNEKAGLDTDFWSLALPEETRRYLPKFLALLALLRDGERPIELPHVPAEIAFEKVDLGRRVSVDRVAEIAGLPETTLRRLNAGLVHGVTPPRGPHALYVPSGSRETLLQRLAAAPPGPLFSLPTSHEVVAGDTLSAIALAYGIDLDRLRALNDLDGTRIRVGQRLAVLDARHGGGASVAHVVASGDTLSDIARRYSVGLDDIYSGDGSPLEDDTIHPGDTLLVAIATRGAG